MLVYVNSLGSSLGEGDKSDSSQSVITIWATHSV